MLAYPKVDPSVFISNCFTPFKMYIRHIYLQGSVHTVGVSKVLKIINFTQLVLALGNELRSYKVKREGKGRTSNK